jgi:3-methyladenine DNA glycosylase AlkD
MISGKIMEQSAIMNEATRLANTIDEEIRSLSKRNTPILRSVRRKYSRTLKDAPPELILQLATNLCKTDDYRWIAYELIRGHQATFECLGPTDLEQLGQGINSWWTVDAFARTLSGPMWLHRRVSDRLILKWTRSNNRWWRRAALVSTMALNVRSQGGQGDVSRTLNVCRNLAGDQDDMVAKALSWALRELVIHNAEAVKEFLHEHDKILAARVKREVKNK